MIERIPIVDRPSWLAMRQKDVTASDIAAVCGVPAFKTKLRLWAEKSGRVPADTGDSNIMHRGRILEASVIEALREVKPNWTIIRANEYLRDPEARIGATPDAFADTPDGQVIVQCKVVARPQFDAAWQDDAPMCYRLQTLTEAMLWGASHAIIAALVIETHSWDFHIYEVPRHAGAEQRLRDEVKAFWELIDSGAPHPPADYRQDASLLELLYRPKEGGKAKDLTMSNRVADLLMERAVVKATIKDNTDRCEAIDAELVEQLDSCEVAFTREFRITHKMQHRKEFVVPAKSFPVLRISRLKEHSHE
jgi:predicted phage-related endonuclease